LASTTADSRSSYRNDCCVNVVFILFIFIIDRRSCVSDSYSHNGYSFNIFFWVCRHG
jgi:hypothetical protein